MSLEPELKAQLAEYLKLLEEPVTISLSADDGEPSQKLRAFLEEIVAMSDRLSLVEKELPYTPSFELAGPEAGGVTFAGIPLGHEFSSFVMALLQVSGRPPVITDEQRERIEALEQSLHFTTYVSLSCQNCPDVVQALNIMSVLNENITHTMIEGGMFQELVEEEGIMAVPTVYLNGEELTAGRQTLDKLLDLVKAPAVGESLAAKRQDTLYDLLVIGGGPGGVASAIYAARKGIKTALIAREFGGQVAETSTIENFIGTKEIEGAQLMAQMKSHLLDYPLDLFEDETVENLVPGEELQVELASGTTLKARTAVIATGARWRLINVPGETELQNRGISYCPHCDGPLFEDKDVVIIGGGNSGVEAALDMSHLARQVTVLEYGDHLNADQVLQDRLSERENVEVIFEADTTEITGEKTVTGVAYTDRATGESHHLAAAGVFILVGLIPNTEWLGDTVELNEYGEIITDRSGATNVPGLYAAGDCTDTHYKQIVVALGTGATAALSAYDELLRAGI